MDVTDGGSGNFSWLEICNFPVGRPVIILNKKGRVRQVRERWSVILGRNIFILTLREKEGTIIFLQKKGGERRRRID